MKENKQLLDAYHSGNLTSEESILLEQWIANGDISLEELEEYQLSMEYLEEQVNLDTSSAMDAKFNTFLAEEKSKLESAKKTGISWPLWLTTPWKIAIPFGLFALSFFFGTQWNKTPNPLVNNTLTVTPNNQYKDFTTTLLATGDVSEKINLVSTTKLTDKIDLKIIEVLLYTLNNDESSNVRLACIDVLSKYSLIPEVLEGLIASIINQNSPIVLSNLADAIAAGGKSLDANEFKTRLNKDLPPQIIKSMEAVVIQL